MIANFGIPGCDIVISLDCDIVFFIRSVYLNSSKVEPTVNDQFAILRLSIIVFNFTKRIFEKLYQNKTAIFEKITFFINYEFKSIMMPKPLLSTF